MEDIPDELMQSFCGVGNPFSIANIQAGSSVLDIGCGAGIDMYVASRLTGPTGKVSGTDLTVEMVERAGNNLETLGVNNVELHHVSSEQLPLPDNSLDLVISNGVINLSPNKAKLFREIFRVLKIGGRLQFADIILDKKLPAHLAVSVESWSQ